MVNSSQFHVTNHVVSLGRAISWRRWRRTSCWGVTWWDFSRALVLIVRSTVPPVTRGSPQAVSTEGHSCKGRGFMTCRTVNTADTRGAQSREVKRKV
jgi:hypothetical protein